MKRLELIKRDSNSFTVIVDDRFADHLTVDEALGVVASALFSRHPLFVKTYEQWLTWHKRYGEVKVPVALIEDRRTT